LKKPGNKPVRPPRRQSEVGVWRDVTKYLLVSTSKKRTADWEDIRIYDWGKIIVSAAETINVTDLLVLFALVKHAQAHPERTKENPILSGSRYVIEVQMDKSELYEAVGNHDYRQVFGDPGKENEKPKMGSIMRLKTWIVQYWQTGDTYPVSQQYLYEYDCELSIYAISREFYRWCCDGENIDYELLKKINSLTAQALYLYLRGHRSNRQPKLETIVKALGLAYRNRHERYEAKRMISEAFQRLHRLGIVEMHFLGDFYYRQGKQYIWRLGINFYGGRLSATPDNYSVLPDGDSNNACISWEI
jgi:hypothetical protein